MDEGILQLKQKQVKNNRQLSKEEKFSSLQCGLESGTETAILVMFYSTKNQIKW